jgi:SAM-dependent methyltransferase
MSTPQFPKHDPASAEFWEVRYRENFTPWDAGRVPALLAERVLHGEKPEAALVPGCGSAHDVAFMARHGWNVLAVDFSPAAVEAARRVLADHAAMGPLGDQAHRVKQADYFGSELAPGGFDFIYERAFLCALPRRMWADWAKRTAELAMPGGYLAGYFYFDSSEKGPPFGLQAGELEGLLAPWFELVEERNPDDSIAVFKGKEKWMVWRRK